MKKYMVVCLLVLVLFPTISFGRGIRGAQLNLPDVADSMEVYIGSFLKGLEIRDTTYVDVIAPLPDSTMVRIAGYVNMGGKLQISDDAVAAAAGVIKWDGTNFQGHTGAAWVPLDVQSASGGGWTDDGTTVRPTTNADTIRCNVFRPGDYRDRLRLSICGGQSNAEDLTTLKITTGTININGSVLALASPTKIDETNLNTGSLARGKTYWVFARNNSSTLDFKLVVEADVEGTKPDSSQIGGMDARAIGYVHCQKKYNPADGTIKDWFIPASVFNDEEGKYTGMVDIGLCKVDIYKSTLRKTDGTWFSTAYTDFTSGQGEYAVSAYNKNPARYISMYEAKEALAKKGKFLLSPYQWYLAISGTPDPYTAAPDTNDQSVNSVAISSYAGTWTAADTIDWNEGSYAVFDSVNVDSTLMYFSSLSQNDSDEGWIDANETMANWNDTGTANCDGIVFLYIEPTQIFNAGGSWPDYIGRKPDGSSWSDDQGGTGNSIKTGTAIRAVSAVGCYDGIGNLWEWVDLTICDGKYNNDISLPAQNYITDYDQYTGLPITTSSAVSKYRNDYFWINMTGLRGMLRSGHWPYAGVTGLFCASLGNAPSNSDASYIGFRGGAW